MKDSDPIWSKIIEHCNVMLNVICEEILIRVDFDQPVREISCNGGLLVGINSSIIWFQHPVGCQQLHNNGVKSLSKVIFEFLCFNDFTNYFLRSDIKYSKTGIIKSWSCKIRIQIRHQKDFGPKSDWNMQEVCNRSFNSVSLGVFAPLAPILHLIRTTDTRWLNP